MTTHDHGPERHRDRIALGFVIGAMFVLIVLVLGWAAIEFVLRVTGGK